MLPETIPVVIVTDEHYAVLLAVLLKSIEVHHKTSEKIAVYIVEDKVKAVTKKKIAASLNADMFSLTWIKMQDALPPRVKLPFDHTTFPLTTYMRLFVPRIVPPGTEKVLFLDVDMLIREDISKLWQHDLGEHTVAAVQDPRLLTVDNDWGGIRNYKALGLHPKTKYFNSGMMVINVPKWVNEQLTERVLKCVKSNIKYANYAEQYGLNVILAEQWLPLNTRWNYFASGDLADPWLIHFVSRKPIYNTYSNNPQYKQIFEDYKALTPWAETKPVSEFHRYIKKMGNVWVKFKKSIS